MQGFYTHPISDLAIDQEGYEKVKKVLIGIADYIADGNYVKGNRNTIAVDFCIACRIINCDPYIIMRYLNLDYNKEENLRKRINVIHEYIPKWWNSGNIKGYALNWENWIKIFDHIQNDPEKDHELRIESALKL